MAYRIEPRDPLTQSKGVEDGYAMTALRWPPVYCSHGIGAPEVRIVVGVMPGGGHSRIVFERGGIGRTGVVRRGAGRRFDDRSRRFGQFRAKEGVDQKTDQRQQRNGPE